MTRANVSVIIPCYCCYETVTRALESVMSQSMLPAEIILVDDASNDNGVSLALLKKLCQAYVESEVLIRLIALRENQGPSGARNTAWDSAKSEFIAFLDADDAWDSKKLEIQYTWMAAHPEVDVCGHFSEQVEGELVPTSNVLQWLSKRCYFHSMLFKNPLMTRSVMMKRDISLRFALDKRYAEDYLLWLQTAASGLNISIIEAVLAYSFKSDYGESGLSGNLWCMEQSVQDNFRRLHRARLIGLFNYAAASVFSYLKYLKRVVIVMFNKKSH